MLSINRLKVNNSTQLNFTSPTGKLKPWTLICLIFLTVTVRLTYLLTLT
jgi:hypothetical protein